jgi:hypothetical protein
MAHVEPSALVVRVALRRPVAEAHKDSARGTARARYGVGLRGGHIAPELYGGVQPVRAF